MNPACANWAIHTVLDVLPDREAGTAGAKFLAVHLSRSHGNPLLPLGRESVELGFVRGSNSTVSLFTSLTGAKRRSSV